jgi:hypothetical protein
MKAYWGNGSIAPCILDLGTRLSWVASFTPRPLHPEGKSPWYPLDRRLRESQNRSGLGVEEKNSNLLPGLDPSVIQPVAQRCTTKLSRLSLEVLLNVIFGKWSLCGCGWMNCQVFFFFFFLELAMFKFRSSYRMFAWLSDGQLWPTWL